MNFQQLSDTQAVYRASGIGRFFIILIGVLIFFVASINIYFANQSDGFSVWVLGFIAWLGWSAMFAKYVCRFDLEKQVIVQKASNFFTIFERAYLLSDVIGLRILPNERKMTITIVFKDNTSQAIMNCHTKEYANDTAKEIAEFINKPILMDTPS